MSRNGARPKNKRGQKLNGYVEDRQMARLIDELQDFEDFRESILPALRADLKKGLSTKEMREKYKSLVQARVLTTAITSDDGRAMAAAKDILDREEGKPTEKKEITHRYADMSDEELDAILKSEEEDLKNLIEHTSQEH